MISSENLTRDELVARCAELEYKLSLKEITTDDAQSTNILRNIFNSVTLGFAALDIDGKVIEFNKAYLEFAQTFYGKTPEKGEHYEDFVPENKLQMIHNYYEQVLKGEHLTFNDEHKINNRNYIFLKTYIPIIDNNGQITGVLVSIQDITQKEEIQSKFARTYNTFYTVINSLQLMVFAVDSKTFDIIFANHFFVAVNGEAKDKNYFDFFQNDELKLKDVKKKLKDIPPQINLINMYEVYLEKFNRWMKVYFRQITWIEGGANIILFYLIDIEDYKQNQKQLEEINQKLESTINERTAELKSLLTDLESEIERRKQTETELMMTKEQISLSLRKEQQLSNVKSRILNNVAHEINTPLTVISTSAFLIDIYLSQQNYSTIPELAKKIQDASSTLFSIVENSQLATNSDDVTYFADYETLNFIDFIKNIMKEIEENDNNNHIFQTILQSHVIILSTNYQMLKQAIIPLYDNAVKYSEKGTVITTKITEDSQNVQLSIIDNGIGISEEDLPYIFDMFYRSQKHIGIVHGSGLGLSIAKQQVEKLGGKIYVQSNENIGSEFTIEIPGINLADN